jgi:hypothetical protein
MTEPAPPAEHGRRKITPLKALLGLSLVAIFAMWMYAFFFASKASPDRIDDTAYQARAEQLCAAADADLDALPPAADARSPQDRAAVLDQANARLDRLVADLAGIGTSPDPEQRVARWIDDWRVYLGDRARHTEKLRAGDDPRFAETPVVETNTPISLRIDAFARVNLMPSCQTPRDIGG